MFVSAPAPLLPGVVRVTEQKVLGHSDAVIGHEATDMATHSTFWLFGHLAPANFVGLDVG